VTPTIHEFVFRGLLAEEALDRAGRRTKRPHGYIDADIAKSLSLDLMDDSLVAPAIKMATVYVAVAAFENSVRKLVESVLIEQKGDDWWSECVASHIQKRAESRQTEEQKIRWHTQRGQDLINYTELGDLVKIMRHNWTEFEPHVHSLEWAESVIGTIERSRNVIMHSGILEVEDIGRIGVNIRDWIKQVGV
jgi:hypothetical protein